MSEPIPDPAPRLMAGDMHIPSYLSGGGIALLIVGLVTFSPFYPLAALGCFLLSGVLYQVEARLSQGPR